MTKAQDLEVQIFDKCRRDPFYFIKLMRWLVPQEKGKPFIKGKHITWQQAQIVWAIKDAIDWKKSNRIAIKSWHGIGKSSCCSWIILWHLFCFPQWQSACTAPSADQLKWALWKEAYTWLSLMPDYYQDMFLWQSDYIRVNESPQDRYARARTGKKETPEALAWVHWPSVLLLGDEASGIDNEIYNTMEWALTWDQFFVILISNPTRNHGYFYDCFNKDKDAWQNFTFSCTESPLNNEDYVNRIATKHGVNSDEYRIRVLGEFPDDEAVDEWGYVALLNPEQMNRWFDSSMGWRVYMWVDPSWDWWDKTQRVIRNWARALNVLEEKISNEKGIADKTNTLMTQYNIHPQDVYIDNFWVWANVAVELALMWKKVNWVNVWSKKDIEDEFINKRAWAFRRLRERCSSWGELVNKHNWVDEIPAIKYKRNWSWKIQIMGKKDMKKQFWFSPDKMDALMLTFYHKKRKRRNWKSWTFTLDYSNKL